MSSSSDDAPFFPDDPSPIPSPPATPDWDPPEYDDPPSPNYTDYPDSPDNKPNDGIISVEYYDVF